MMDNTAIWTTIGNRPIQSSEHHGAAVSAADRVTHTSSTEQVQDYCYVYEPNTPQGHIREVSTPHLVNAQNPVLTNQVWIASMHRTRFTFAAWTSSLKKPLLPHYPSHALRIDTKPLLAQCLCYRAVARTEFAQSDLPNAVPHRVDLSRTSRSTTIAIHRRTTDPECVCHRADRLAASCLNLLVDHVELESSYRSRRMASSKAAETFFNSAFSMVNCPTIRSSSAMRPSLLEARFVLVNAFAGSSSKARHQLDTRFGCTPYRRATSFNVGLDAAACTTSNLNALLCVRRFILIDMAGPLRR